jgi:hypothetical protein
MARAVGDGPSKTFDTLVEEGIADGYTRIDNNPGLNEPRPVIRDDRGLLEGTGIPILRVPTQRRGGRSQAGRARKKTGVSGNDTKGGSEKLFGLNPDITVTYLNGAAQ